MKLFVTACILSWVASSSVAISRDLYVDPSQGNDRADGLSSAVEAGSGPVATIRRAVQMAEPGDVIRIVEGIDRVYEQVLFAEKSGTKEEPIVFDGQGAIIDGSVPIVREEWELVSEGLYRSTVIPEKYCYGVNPAYVGRFFFVWEGEINRMGRSLKGPKEPYMSPEELSPGQWTYVEGEAAFYLRIEPDITLEEAPVRVPKIVSGVQISGECHNLIIRNVTVTHVINDGFALTTGSNKQSTVENIRFENIVAKECGDDGLSAHGDCEVYVDGFLSIANSTGYCSQGVSINRNVRMEEIHGVEIFPIGGRHEFINTTVVGHAAQPVTVLASAPFETSELILENCLILAAPGRKPVDARMRIQKGGVLRADRLSTQGISIQVSGLMELSNSVIAGGREVTLNILEGAEWEGSNNLYDIGLFLLEGTRFAPRDFSTFSTAAHEEGSSVRPISALGEASSQSELSLSVGADLSRLP
tara:strand:- start:20248 stop:21666 length:1419 start_codon:yes stop_codon:yes gene_type:complete